jgi:hypothetical protein
MIAAQPSKSKWMYYLLQELACCVPCWLLADKSSLIAQSAGAQAPGSSQQKAAKQLIRFSNAKIPFEVLPEHLKLHRMHDIVAETVEKLLQLASVPGITCFASIKAAV